MPVTVSSSSSSSSSSFIFSRLGITTSAAAARTRSRFSVIKSDGNGDLKVRDLRIGASFLCSQLLGMASAKEEVVPVSTSSVSVKENVSRRKLVELCDFQGDAVKLERMTVQELRTALRSFGASSKGRKHELVSALKLILESKVEGDRSLMMDEGPVKGTPNAETSGSNESLHGLKRPRTVELISESTSKYTEVSEVQESAYEIEPWTTFAHKKPQKGWVVYNPRTMRPPPLPVGTKCVKLVSWNVNGLRALRKFNGFSAKEFAEREGFDVLCLQETKLQEKDVEAVKDLLEGFENSYWTCSSSTLGYSGTAIISRSKPLSISYGLGISDHDSEGRIVTAEFDDYYLASVYVPNSGDGLKRLSYRVKDWDPSLSGYLKELEKSKPVILAGDLNCAHQEIDIYNPAGNKRSAGFTDEERQSFEESFLDKGFVDTFRKQHPNVVGYTYWGYRHGGRKTNKGWRLDYYLVSESIAEQVHDSYILPDVTGSDHCPIGLVLKL